MYYILFTILACVYLYMYVYNNKKETFYNYYEKKLYNKSTYPELKYVCSLNKHLRRKCKYI